METTNSDQKPNTWMISLGHAQVRMQAHSVQAFKDVQFVRKDVIKGPPKRSEIATDMAKTGLTLQEIKSRTGLQTSQIKDIMLDHGNLEYRNIPSRYMRPLFVKDSQTGVMTFFSSVVAAAKATGFSAFMIYRATRDGRRYRGRSYLWADERSASK